MIQMRHHQPSLWETFFGEEVAELWEPWMRVVDELLEDDSLLDSVYDAQGRRHRHSRGLGRRQTPSEVVLRMLILKHVRNWSYDTLEREVRANVVYRTFCRIGMQKVPDAKTLVRLGQAIGPEVIAELHDRIVAIAQERKVIRGRKMRVDTTVVETNIHYRMSSKCWCIQRESTPPGQESEPCSLGGREEGNQILRVHRRSRPWDGERVIGP